VLLVQVEEALGYTTSVKVVVLEGGVGQLLGFALCELIFLNIGFVLYRLL
jgi:hypothetical protein